MTLPIANGVSGNTKATISDTKPVDKGLPTYDCSTL